MADLAAVTAGATPPPPGPEPVSPVGPDGTVPPVAEPGKSELGSAEAPKADDTSVPFDATKLELPEGMKNDDPLLKSFTDLLADGKMSKQDMGQKLLGLYTEAQKSAAAAARTAWENTNADWVKAVKSDPEIGGAKFNETKTTIARAIDQLGPELSVAFRQGLDVTGAGNHPAIWKGLAKMAALLTEGGHVAGNPPKAQPNLGETFFPNSKMT